MSSANKSNLVKLLSTTKGRFEVGGSDGKLKAETLARRMNDYKKVSARPMYIYCLYNRIGVMKLIHLIYVIHGALEDGCPL